MTEPDDLEPRVAALENDVRRLSDEVRRTREDAAAARVLAGGADRDVGELGAELRDFRQATISTMNAMRDDMTSLSGRVDLAVTEMRGRLDAAATGQQQIADMLRTLLDRNP